LGGLLVLRPFISAILWAAVLCFSTWGAYQRLLRLVRGRSALAAGIMTALISLVLVVPFIVVVATLAGNVSRMGEWFRFLDGGLPTEAPESVVSFPLVGGLLERSWSDIVEQSGDLTAFLKRNALALGKWFLANAINFTVGVAQLVLSLLVAYLFYRAGDQVVERIKVGGRRIMGDAVQQHVTIVGQTIRSVVYGIIGTAMAQGIMGGLGYWIAGVPSPFLLGLLTMAFSLLPMGPPFIWVPVTIWLYMNGPLGWAVFMAVWGLIAISGIDNLVKPYFIMQGTNLPFVIILFGVVGGVLAFGVIGLFLGPVLLAVGYRLICEFTDKGEKKALSRP